jgi:lipopolysaccharide export system protein LptA
MRANLMRVYLNTLGEGDESIEGIDRIEVFGDVHIVQEKMMATGEKGEYIHSTKAVVLTGTPEKQAYAEDAATNRSIQADLIRVDLTTNDFEGEGNVKFSVLSGLSEILQEN